MRALLVFSVLLLSQLSFAQEPAAAPAAPAPAAPATEEAPAVTVPSAFKTGILVSPSFTMFQRKLEQDVAGATPGNAPGSFSGDVKGTDLGVRAGYVFDFGLFAGLNLMYNTGKDGSTTVTTYGLAPSIGYNCKYTGLWAALSYHVAGKSKIESAGSNVDYDQVTGLQFDLAYPIQLTEKINVGPQLTWRRLKLDEASTGTGEVKTKEFLPSISAWFYF